jgi:hypothetical protein
MLFDLNSLFNDNDWESTMAVKTRIDSTLGPVSYTNDAGVSFERHANNRGFFPFAVDSVMAVTSGSTFDAAACGVNTVSASTAVTGVMPKASDVPGATIIFRNLSTGAVLLTGSQETAGSKVFVNQNSGTLTIGNSAKLSLPGLVGASVLLQSDGLSFHVLSYSGSVTLS